MAAGLYAGTTLADDGSPILLIDPSGIAAAAGVVLDQNELEKLAAKAPEPVVRSETTPALLFVGLDGVKRAIRLGVVERIEDIATETIQLSAGRLRVAIGERILPLAGTTVVPEQKVRILRLTDGLVELAYAFREVIDMVELGPELQPAASAGEISGVTLISGDQVEVVDPYWLFAVHAREGSDTRKPVCVLPLDDAWMSNILRPIVENAGYRVVRSGDDEAAAADVVIASAEAEAPAPLEGKLLRIRSHPDLAHEKDDSIYRYDRAGLLAALSRSAGFRKG
jgi:two-component system chemotaxis sensor kinase CheA